MFQGLILFFIAAVLVVVAFLTIQGRRHADESTEAPEDRLTDEEFRRIEFGDEDL